MKAQNKWLYGLLIGCFVMNTLAGCSDNAVASDTIEETQIILTDTTFQTESPTEPTKQTNESTENSEPCTEETIPLNEPDDTHSADDRQISSREDGTDSILPVATKPSVTQPAETIPATIPSATETPTTEPITTVPPETEPTHTHSYTDTVVDPTCSSQGYTDHVCICGHSYRDSYQDKVHHLLMETERVPSSVDADGYIIYSCIYGCGRSETEIIPKLTEVFDTASLIAYGMSYAESLGFTPSYSALPGYFPPITNMITTMDDARQRVAGKVYSLYSALMYAAGTVEGCQVNVSVVDNGDATYTITVYYG